MVSHLVVQLQIFWQLHLVDLKICTWYIQGLTRWFRMLLFFTNSGLLELQVGYYALFYRFSVMDDSVSSEWEVFARISSQGWCSWKASFLALCFSYYTLIIFMVSDAFCNVAINADDSTLYSHYGWSYDLLQQLELACDLESDLQDIHSEWIGLSNPPTFRHPPLWRVTHPPINHNLEPSKKLSCSQTTHTTPKPTLCRANIKKDGLSNRNWR